VRIGGTKGREDTRQQGVLIARTFPGGAADARLPECSTDVPGDPVPVQGMAGLRHPGLKHGLDVANDGLGQPARLLQRRPGGAPRLLRVRKGLQQAYPGDATVGERVNYGAGSITANYDGANKFRTVIEADVHVGSASVLVAPVTLGAGCTIGGGSTITKDVPPGQLAVARGKQVLMEGWTRPVKQTKG